MHKTVLLKHSKEPITLYTNEGECYLEAMIKRSSPYFFQKTNGRQRESFSYYKGCVIAHYTSPFKTRYHVPYMIDGPTGQIFCLLNGCNCMGKATDAIDKAIETGQVE
jgi:hypothetical protein